jgi:glycosyltransferase involved in cell wall biosynthesis
LVIAGKGELLEKCIEYAKQKQIRNIKFLGYVSEKDKLLLFSSSDYYILVSNYEGQPLTLLEAMSSGLACIVSDIPNLKNVEDAECGLIIDTNNISKTSKELIEYLRKNHSDHSKNARKYAIKNLDWKIITEKYLDEFNKIWA